MNESTLKRAERVYFEVLHAPAAQRAAALARACAGDDRLRSEVESLLAHSVGAGEFLEEPALGTDFRLLGAEAAPDTLPGTVIGNFRIEQRLASGGMGTVYLARREGADFEQRVALKIVKRGMDSEEIVERFRAERRTLAALNHPNIARLIDGGMTSGGQPYLAMEYVDGIEIDEYCDRHCLSTLERLDLFLKVCEAVRYAHQSLVVHRDLKPGNILVTPDGQPKLLDFGVARLLTDAGEASITVAAERRLTPEYASPEQIAGEPVTTSSDVYSLGVILYELLTGRRPYTFRSRTTAEFERVIRELEPPAPSAAVLKGPATIAAEECADDPSAPGKAGIRPTRPRNESTPQRLRRRLRGDLDNIVMMALRKDPARRYASVEQLAADIRRYLSDEPVLARPDTPAYVLRKFIARHRVGTAAAVVIVGVLVFGVLFSRWQRDEAYIARDQAERIADFMQQVLGAADAADTRAVGSDARVQDVLAAAAARAESDLADSPRTLAAVRSVIGRGYLGLGMYPQASEHIRAGLALREKILPAGHHDIAESKIDLAHLHYAVGEFDDAERLLRESLSTHQRLRGNENADTARVLNDLGAVLRSAGKTDEAEAAHRRALEVRRRLSHGADTVDIAESLNNLAAIQRARGDAAGAVASLEESTRIRTSLLPPEHPLVVQSMANLAVLKAAAGDIDAGITLMQQTLPMEARALGPEHPDHARSLSSLASMLVHKGRAAEAEPYAREALDIRRKRLTPEDPVLWTSQQGLARVLAAQAKTDEARTLLEGIMREMPRGDRLEPLRRAAGEEIEKLTPKERP